MRTTLFWIAGPWPGRFAITPRPRGGDWLDDDVRAWQQAGLNMVVSLLTPAEVAELGLSQEEACCQAYGMQFCTFPITDLGVPVSRQACVVLMRQLTQALSEGKHIAVHCRQSIGRSGLLASCLLVGAGVDPETAFERASAARGCLVPETPEQREWVRALAPELLQTPPQDRL
jgi:protein-tyrosine phosphatase